MKIFQGIGRKMKKENERIRIIRRIGMPETNSSSSHAVSISMSGENLIKPGDREWDIEITDDGVLRIPGGRDFGWEYFKTNSLQTKLQYLSGIYCSEIKTDRGKKSIFKLKKILKEIFGVKDVEFTWITEYSKRLKEVEDPEDAYYDYPEIDHNSHDIFEEITENFSVIRAFLLSRDSWLYGGNDNSEAPEGFYSGKPVEEKRVTAIASIEVGGEYGRVDWEIISFPNPVDNSLIDGLNDEFNILENIYYDDQGEAKSYEFNDSDECLKQLVTLKDSTFTYFGYSIWVSPEGTPYMLFTKPSFRTVWEEVRKEEKNSYAYYSKEVLEKTIAKTKEGVDYIKKEVKITMLDYGKWEIF